MTELNLEHKLEILQQQLDLARQQDDREAESSTLVEIGDVFRASEKIQLAVESYQQAVAIRREVLGASHPDTAQSLNKLGLALRGIGRLAEAQRAFTQALEIDQAAFGPDHTNVSADLANLGLIMQDLGDLDSAQTYYEQALRIDESKFGSNHPRIATDLNNLGSVLQDLGDLKNALGHYERALGIDEEVFGPEHPNVATALNNLGSVLLSLGDLDGAQAALERALKTDEAYYRENHPKVAVGANNLGSILQVRGDLSNAQTYYERALAIQEKALGTEHPDTAITLNNLGLVRKEQGDLSGAQAYYERALTIQEKTLGSEHPDTITTLKNLRRLLPPPGMTIDRQEVIDLFDQFMQSDSHLRVLRLHGEAKMGKSHMLTKVFPVLAQQKHQAVCAVVDLRSQVNIPDILHTMSSFLAPRILFSNFNAAYQEWLNRTVIQVKGLTAIFGKITIRTQEETRLAAERTARHLSAQFACDLREFTDASVLLLLDSIDNTDSSIQEWVMNMLLAQLASMEHVRVVVAGRYVPEVAGSYAASSISYELKPIRDESAYIAYCRQMGVALNTQSVRDMARVFGYRPGLFADFVIPKFTNWKSSG